MTIETIRWSAADCENVAPPQTAAMLLNTALQHQPENPVLHARMANLHLMQYDFASAVERLEEAQRLDPAQPFAVERLPGCYNVLGLHDKALAALSAVPKPHRERGVAYEALGRLAEAEAEFRAVLELEPSDRVAGRKLCRMLRRSGRWAELLSTCEELHRRGVGHTQLLSDWGTALALAGDWERARAILFDERRVARLELPVPEGWSDISAFNRDLARELLANPHPVTEVPTAESANRGSARIHSLLAGPRPNIIVALLRSLERLVAAYAPARYDGFDPWLDARPSSAHLQPWGLLQRDTDYEELHIHRDGWLSGVYYVQIPKEVTADGDGRGCIEFGPPRAVSEHDEGAIPARRFEPREGTLLLAPSHYPHRTIPTGVSEERISFAFDVVPDPR
jgi:tetratricopeptide (TPR) repeat protein